MVRLDHLGKAFLAASTALFTSSAIKRMEWNGENKLWRWCQHNEIHRVFALQQHTPEERATLPTSDRSAGFTTVMYSPVDGGTSLPPK